MRYERKMGIKRGADTKLDQLVERFLREKLVDEQPLQYQTSIRSHR